MTAEPSLEVLLGGLSFPEGLRWRRGKLWFSDFYRHAVQTVDLDGRTETVAIVPQRPSGLGFTPDGQLLVVSMLDHRLLRIDGTEQHVVADLSAFAGGPCNDMVVDRQGRAYVGNFGYDKNNGEAPRLACITRTEPDGRTCVAADALSFPNGTIISSDGRTLIVAETFAHRLTRFAIDPQGGLSDR